MGQGGLISCLPVNLTPQLFPHFDLSPHAYFYPDNADVLVNTAGSFLMPHIDRAIASGILIVIGGAKLFISWPYSNKNCAVMKQEAHHHLLNWANVLAIMHKMEKSHSNYSKKGNAMYLAAGLPHMAFSQVRNNQSMQSNSSIQQYLNGKVFWQHLTAKLTGL